MVCPPCVFYSPQGVLKNSRTHHSSLHSWAVPHRPNYSSSSARSSRKAGCKLRQPPTARHGRRTVREQSVVHIVYYSLRRSVGYEGAATLAPYDSVHRERRRLIYESFCSRKLSRYHEFGERRSRKLMALLLSEPAGFQQHVAR